MENNFLGWDATSHMYFLVKQYSWLVAFTSASLEERVLSLTLGDLDFRWRFSLPLCLDLSKSLDKKHFLCLGCIMGKRYHIGKAYWGLLRDYVKVIYGQWTFKEIFSLLFWFGRRGLTNRDIRFPLPDWQSGYFYYCSSCLILLYSSFSANS